MSLPNFIINPAPPLAAPELTEALRGMVVSHLSDNLQRLSGITGLLPA